MRINVTSPLTPAEAGVIATGRNLVPFEPQAQAEHRSGITHPTAVFLAHLIGAVQGAPQSRARRRLGASDASAIYAAAGKRTTAATCRPHGYL